jgi:Holliday junction resolvase RusA-like endonuclease
MNLHLAQTGVSPQPTNWKNAVARWFKQLRPNLKIWTPVALLGWLP